MTFFISGGAKNGKSTLAQNLAVALAKGNTHYYVATMIPVDDEDRLRIQRHIEDREGLGFTTLECGRNILSCLEHADPKATFLLDSVTALLMNELFREDQGYQMDLEAARRCGEDLETFAKTVGNAVFVSDYIASDAGRYDETTEQYRKILADIDRRLARVSDTVVEVSAGQYIIHKGALPL